MARAVAKVTAHAAGGAENAAYIARPQEERSRAAEPRPGEEPVAGRGERLAEMREGDAGSAQGRVSEGSDVDPVWGWNIPWFVTGEAHGVWETEEGRTLLESRSLALAARHLGLGPAPPSAAKLSADEKRENLIAHFSALADLEERQKGLSHFRIILTVGPEVSVGELKAMVNDFLRANFPLCPAFVAVHDDTKHRHAHVYVHARQLDNRRVALGQDYFRLDESWIEICSKHLNRPEIYEHHVELKEETRAWSERAEKARVAGKPLPPKPDRWGDHHDTLLVFRPFDDRWCGRLQAQAKVAETRVKWLEATKARPENLAVARDEAQRLRARLDEAVAKRGKSKSESKRALPAEVITISEQRDLLRYERDILKAEKGRGARRKRLAPELTFEQSALRFDELSAPDAQFGFDFQGPAGPSRVPDPKQPPATPDRKPTARGRASAEALPGSAAVAPASAREAARSFGLELMSEVRLALTEARLSAERSAKERRRLKEQLIEDRCEHARARDEAGHHRSALTALGADEPPCRLKADERGYLDLMSKRVGDSLRIRIEAAVARAEIIPDHEEEVPARRTPEPVPPVEVSRPTPPKAESSWPATDGRPGGELTDTKREETAPEGVRPAHPALDRQTETARAAPRTMPDDEVRLLTIRYELAMARARALRVAEQDFNAAPHRWVSPRHKESLAGLEEKIASRLERGADVSELREAAEQVRSELPTERVRLPTRRRMAEDEVRPLEERLLRELAARAKLGMEMPDAGPSAEELRELLACAEAARDARQLWRVYEVERDQALREANETGSGGPVQLLEERYAGVQFVAEVRADRSKVALARDTKEPGKTLLPATDEAERYTVATLEQAGARKGFAGAISRFVESGGRRRLREQLLETKDAYLGHLRADAEGREAFRDAALKIARECRELGLKFGYYVPAVPNLSLEKMEEVRAHAVTRDGARSERWMSDCAQSQKQKDERELAAVAAARAASTVEILLPGATGENLAELSRREVEAGRERLSMEHQRRVTQAVADRDRLGSPDDPGPNRAEPDRGGDFDFGR
jgi:hypothetical protein